MYGPGVIFGGESSPVLAALFLKIHRARLTNATEVTLWGSGRPLREFLYVDDFADAVVFLIEHYSDEAPINVGTGEEVTILELAQLIAKVVGWHGRFVFDSTKPDGSARKCLEASRVNELGWQPSVTLEDGIRATCEWFRGHCSDSSETARL